jgi:hypothetical protein
LVHHDRSLRICPNLNLRQTRVSLLATVQKRGLLDRLTRRHNEIGNCHSCGLPFLDTQGLVEGATLKAQTGQLSFVQGELLAQGVENPRGFSNAVQFSELI